MLVSTGDIPISYSVIGPLYFCLTNRGFFSSQFKTLKAQYTSQITAAKQRGEVREQKRGLSEVLFLIAGDLNIEHHEYELALFLAVEEIKKRALRLGADAITWLRHDMDIDTSGLEFFYLQMSGTAVRFKTAEKQSSQPQ